MAQKPPEGIKILVRNRKALHDFHIHDKVEAGIVLVGSEVKSLRDAKAVISDAHGEIRNGEAWIVGLKINEYPWANQFNHEVGRTRKLLLHRREIDKLATKTQQRGFTLIPLSLYLKNGKIKLEMALVTNKKEYDKRQAKREATDKRDIDRAIKDAKR